MTLLAAALLAAAALQGPRAGASTAPTAALDGAGRLWVVFVEGDHVYVTSSRDQGRTFTPAVAVNRAPEKIDANGESRPKIALGPRGRVYVTYTRKLDKPYTGEVRFSRSADGRRFVAPVTLNDDGLATGHRFDALAVNARGEVYVAWIDKRDRDRAEAAGQAYEGAALYFTVSRDGGRTFAPNRKLRDNACECCRLALDFDAQGRGVLLWRDILAGNVRDHSILRFGPDGVDGPVARASFDDWEMTGCPHHGPSLSLGEDGTFHLAWFSAGRKAQGLLYARSTDGGRAYSEPLRFGTTESSSRPVVLAAGGEVFLAWKESLPASGTAVLSRRSSDGGRTWSQPHELARTLGGSDHPLLLRSAQGAALSWFTEREGYRLVGIPPAAPARLVHRR